MISKQAVRTYFDRQLDSYVWIKRVGYDRLLKRIYSLSKRNYLFKTKPYRHQVACMYIGICLERFLFFLDMGTGKTKIILDILSFLKREGEITRALVLVPNIINVDGWREQVEEHSYLSFHGILGTTQEKWADFAVPVDICCTHYPGFIVMMKDYGRKNSSISQSAVDWIVKNFDVVVIDESHKIKNHNTELYKILSKIAHRVRFFYGATGTPFNKPEDLWTQFKLVDGGETLGPTLGIFRAAFFIEKILFGRKYIFKERMKSGLNKMMQNRSIRYLDSECDDLPKRVDVPVSLTLSEEAEGYYNSAHEALIEAAIESGVDIKNNFTIMREVCSGFIQWKDEDRKRQVVEFSTNPKLDALLTLIDEMPKHRKAVIFHEFVPSGRMIARALKKAKIGYAEVRGEIDDPIAEVQRFKSDPECRFLIANSKSAGEGGNFQKVANAIIFFESPVSLILRLQCVKRVWRGGQTAKRVYIYDMLTKDTVEEDILESLNAGVDLFELLMNGKAKIRRPGERYVHQHRYQRVSKRERSGVRRKRIERKARKRQRQMSLVR